MKVNKGNAQILIFAVARALEDLKRESEVWPSFTLPITSRGVFLENSKKIEGNKELFDKINFQVEVNKAMRLMK